MIDRDRIPVFPSLFLLVVCLILISAVPATAQQIGDWEWIALDESPPGTPITVSPTAQDFQETRLRVTIHGYYQRLRVGEDQLEYLEFRFPGMGNIGQRGAPVLPQLSASLLLPTVNEQPRLGRIEVLNLVTRRDVLLWPQPIPELDHEEGEPERFQRDDQLYALDVSWPQADGPESFASYRYGGLLLATEALAWPCKWNPTQREMQIPQEFEVPVFHPGGRGEAQPMTLRRSYAAREKFINWSLVAELFPIELRVYEGEFLFLYPQGHRDPLLPLIDQKKTRGFHVTEIELDEPGTCASIQALIDNWYASTPNRRDHYCIMVGDTDWIPLCDAPENGYYGTAIPTDDLYASTVGDDLNEEVYLGRLSVDSLNDLETQVRKILNYEDHGATIASYWRALLVAHDEGAPGKYEGAHESVRTATYSQGAPIFVPLYGSAGARDGDVVGEIERGAGVVAYRGHGNSTAWTSWNPSADYFNGTDINSLNQNFGTTVWSFACTNANLDYNDCVGEVWMEHPDGGAVAHYGATEPSWTSQNHELDRAMFRAVYDYGLTTISHAIESAEDEMAAAVGSDNAWMYLLLGDPDMEIQGGCQPCWFTVIAPEYLEPCAAPPCQVEVSLRGEGLQLANNLVSAYKPGDEAQTNGYTDAGGNVTLTIDQTTSEGTMKFVVRDFRGHDIPLSIPVQQVTSTPAAGGPQMQLRADPPVMSRDTRLLFGRAIDTEVDVQIFDIRGRLLRTLRAEPGVESLQWDGRDSDGVDVSSGVYYVRATTRGYSLTTKVVKVR